VRSNGQKIPLGVEVSGKKKRAVPEQENDKDFAFSVTKEDHCETPLVAYEDLKPVLSFFKKDLSIYDPYFCAGGVKDRLGSLGFEKVRNRNEDCYKVWNSVDFDLLLTNPPYSGNHLDKLVDFCFNQSKPFMWLVPDWVHKRESFVKALKNRRPIYLSPKRRYVYEPPPNLRDKKKSDTQKKTSPFHSIWILWAQDQTDALADFCKQHLDPNNIQIARSRSQLRDLRRINSSEKKHAGKAGKKDNAKKTQAASESQQQENTDQAKETTTRKQQQQKTTTLLETDEKKKPVLSRKRNAKEDAANTAFQRLEAEEEKQKAPPLLSSRAKLKDKLRLKKMKKMMAP